VLPESKSEPAGRGVKREPSNPAGKTIIVRNWKNTLRALNSILKKRPAASCLPVSGFYEPVRGMRFRGPSGDHFNLIFDMLSASFRKTRWLGLALTLAVGLCPLASGQTSLDNTLSSLEKWVEMERRIADESARWDVEKESLQDLIMLYKEELAGLTETIREAEEDVSAAEAARSKLNAEGERLAVIEDKVRAAITAAENDLKTLHTRLPQPLKDSIAPVFSQLPENPEDTKLSIAQRIQFVVASLTQIQKFNTSVTMEEGFREFEAGRQVQIDAIYFGLGAAYYVDKATENAGYGVIGPDGWRWQDDAAIAPLVRQLLEVYQTPGKAAFVELPVEIN
jgi:hypothetical protein